MVVRPRSRRARLTLGGFPTKRIAKLRYTTYDALNPGAGNVTSTLFRLNSCYDPLYSTGGHQPRFFDQFMVLYERYTVIGSKITVTWQPTTEAETTGNPAQFGIYIPKDANDASLPPFGIAGNPQSILENKGMGPTRLVGASGTTPRGRPASITKKWSAKRYFGDDIIKNAGITSADNDYSGTNATNPENGALAICYALAMNGATTPFTFHFRVQIDYIVLFTGLINPAGS